MKNNKVADAESAAASAAAASKPPPSDAIEEAIGGIGRYQILLCLLIFVTKFPVAFHQLGIVFLAPPASFVCLDEGDGLNKTNYCPCTNKEFDTSIFHDTIVMSFDLVCERAWLADFTQTCFMLGILVGSVLFGSLSDKFGRKKPLVGAVFMQLIACLATAFAPEYWSFTSLRFLVGMATGGTMVAGYVLTMEFVGKAYREPTSALYQLPFNFGHLLLAGLGYLFRTWSTLQLALTVPSVIMLVYFWLIPESPRWLLAVGETDHAVRVLEKTAKANNMPTERIAENINNYQLTKPKEQMQKATLLDLFRTPNVRRNTICMTLNWLVCGFGYFGVSQYIGRLAGNIFVNVAISATITIPGTLVSIPLMRRFGRRTLMVATFCVTSACLFAIAAIPEDLELLRVVLACVGDVGMFIGFIVIYLYASELFPTVARNVGIGLSSMMARVGSMVAPYVAALGAQAAWLPPVIFGAAPLVGAALCLLMPETKDCELTNTIDEAERYGSRKKK